MLYPTLFETNKVTIFVQHSSNKSRGAERSVKQSVAIRVSTKRRWLCCSIQPDDSQTSPAAATAAANTATARPAVHDYVSSNPKDLDRARVRLGFWWLPRDCCEW